MLLHYTSIDTLLSILKVYQENIVNHKFSKSEGVITLWASSIYTMNDPLEMKYGDDFLRKVIPALEKNITGAKGSLLDVIKNVVVGDMNRNDVQELIDNHLFDSHKTPFVISLSHCEDDLYMWHQYGDSCNGVCLSFDDCVATNLDFKIYAGDVNYGKGLNDKSLIVLLLTELQTFSDHMQMLTGNELFKAIITYSDLLSIISPFVKNKGYSNEQEYRISFWDDNFKKVQFRIRNNIIVPYLHVDIPIHRLKRITLDPCSKKEENKRSL